MSEYDSLSPGKNEGGGLPWNVVLAIGGWKYTIVKFEASQSMPLSRSSVNTGRFAVVMPPSEMRALIEDVEDRVDGSGSYTQELPFGLLVRVLERPSCIVEDGTEDGGDGIIYTARREMVEFKFFCESEEEESSVSEGSLQENGRP